MPLLKSYDENLEELKFFELYDLAVKKIIIADKLEFKSFEDIALFSLLSHQFDGDFINDDTFNSAYLKIKSGIMSFQEATDEIDLEELDNWDIRRMEKLNV